MRMNEALRAGTHARRWWSSLSLIKAEGAPADVVWTRPTSVGSALLVASGPFKVEGSISGTLSYPSGASTLVLPEVVEGAKDEIKVWAPDAMIVYAWLAPRAVTLSPLDGSWLVDFGFRLPGVLIGH